MPYRFLAPDTTRPPAYGRQHAVATTHYLATASALRILDAGGNAVDAGVAAGLVINVVQPDETSIAGIVPILVYDTSARRPHAICGVGPWSRAVPPGAFVPMGEIPQGPRSVVVPAAIDA